MDAIYEAIRAAGATIGQLVRAIVRDELRRHLGPDADRLLDERVLLKGFPDR